MSGKFLAAITLLALALPTIPAAAQCARNSESGGGFATGGLAQSQTAFGRGQGGGFTAGANPQVFAMAMQRMQQVQRQNQLMQQQMVAMQQQMMQLQQQNQNLLARLQGVEAGDTLSQLASRDNAGANSLKPKGRDANRNSTSFVSLKGNELERNELDRFALAQPSDGETNRKRLSK